MRGNIDIPMTTASPSIDKAIARSYGIDSLEQKIQNKTALQEELGWPAEPKRAMVCIPSGVSDRLGGAILKDVLAGLLELPVQILILGKGSASYGDYLTKIAAENSHKIAIIPNDETAIRKMLAASDMALFLSDAEGTPELSAALAYGVVPVAPACKQLQNYNPNQESGHGFLFEKETSWMVFASMVRALETYRFPFDWRTIQKHCMEGK